MITLLSDFGLEDPYVAQMKALIYSALPGAQIVDISHGVEKHNVAIGSYLLETTVPFFPDGSIHVAVVDPGVGGTRLPIAISCDHGTLIGPDNGLMAGAADRLGFRNAYEIKNAEFNREKVSSTFHGRDIFAYSAARLAQGRSPSEVGPKLRSIVKLTIPGVDFSGNEVTCTVLFVDSFGNVVTNITPDYSDRLGFQERRPVRISASQAAERYEGLAASSYFDIPTGMLGLLAGSQGYLEVALREASAAAKLRVKPLDRLKIQIS